MSYRSRLFIVALLALLVLLPQAAPRPAQANTGEVICFEDKTPYCLTGRFLDYWRQNGGLPVFGYPISLFQNEANPDTGKTYLTQWFERNRFEMHPENRAPYDVLLGRLGDQRLRQLGRDWRREYESRPINADCTAVNVDNLQFAVCEPFRTYYNTHGLEFDGRSSISPAESLALFGLPLTQAKMETNSSGDRVLTQWFERARFEYHPTNPDPYKVLLGRLGAEVRGNAR
ncbi:MAG TPA: hypothetical protein VFZ66_15990 [Herpetosiphonaceae bacterium]